MDYLNRGRWFYDPERGLQRTCKNPQKADTALRQFWTKERKEAEKEHPPEPDEPKPLSEPQAGEIPKPAKSKGSGKQAKKNIGTEKAQKVAHKRGRKPKQVVRILCSESETSEFESDHEDPPPSPKRSRRQMPGPTPKRLEPDSINVDPPAIPAANPVMLSRTTPPTPPGSVDAPAVLASAFSNAVVRAPENATSSPSSMLKMFMSMAYDNAAVNARMLEVARRERECDRRQQMMDEAALKSQFMDQAAQAAKSFFFSR